MILIVVLDELTNPPVLVIPDWDAASNGSRPFRLNCDASIDGFGGTLEQEQPDGSIRPIVYVSPATIGASFDTARPRSITWPIKRPWVIVGPPFPHLH